MPASRHVAIDLRISVGLSALAKLAQLQLVALGIRAHTLLSPPAQAHRRLLLQAVRTEVTPVVAALQKVAKTRLVISSL